MGIQPPLRVAVRVDQPAGAPGDAGFRESFITVQKCSTFGASPIYTRLLEEFNAQVKPQLPSYVAGFAAYITLN